MPSLSHTTIGTRWRGASGDVATVEREEAGIVYGKWDSGVLWSEFVTWLPKLYVEVDGGPNEGIVMHHQRQRVRLVVHKGGFHVIASLRGADGSGLQTDPPWIGFAPVVLWKARRYARRHGLELIER